MMDINMFKGNLLSVGDLEKCKLNLEEAEVRAFWESLTPVEMERLLFLNDGQITEYVLQYFHHYSQERKLTPTDIYEVRYESTPVLYIYDAKLFKSKSFTKHDNDVLTSFLLVQKAEGFSLIEPPKHVHEFFDTNLLLNHDAMIKVKANSILKVYSLFKPFIDGAKGEAVVLPREFYSNFMINWTKGANYYQNCGLDAMVKMVFQGLSILIHNNILLEFSRSLSEEQKERRRYEKPVNIIKKPRNIDIETSTMIEKGLGDVSWHTMRIKAYRLKYIVKEQEDQELCFRDKKGQREEEPIIYQRQFIKPGDEAILEAFSKAAMLHVSYDY